MSNQKNQRKRSQNRPTDPFGGPSKRGNTVSFTVVLIAIAFFLVLQWTGGDLGGLLNTPAALPTNAPVATRQPTRTPTPTVASETPTSDAVTSDAAASDQEDDAQEDDAQEADEQEAEDEAPVAQVTQQPTQAPTATSTSKARGVQTPRATVQPTPTANSPPAARASDLPTIRYEDLPPEAHDTIALIEQGGPFPFSRDGITFQNRERLLPIHPQGYYREYTVITPGERTRGARRIVTGEGGEMYYTDDHYASFREIVR